MTFSGLEMLVIGSAMSILTGIVTRILTAKSHVKKDVCFQTHKQVQKDIDGIKNENHKQKGSLDALYRMVRALVVYSDIPANEKQRILNERVN